MKLFNSNLQGKNIKISHDDFVALFYKEYIRLRSNNLFEKGYEDYTFKVWKYNDMYYLLQKSDGLLICWTKLLGFQLKSNQTLTYYDFEHMCESLSESLDVDNIYIPDDSLDVID